MKILALVLGSHVLFEAAEPQLANLSSLAAAAFVILDLEPPCRSTVAQLFFLHGFHNHFLNWGVYRLLGTPFGIVKHPTCQT